MDQIIEDIERSDVYIMCALCDLIKKGEMVPCHNGSPRCESGSQASGGIIAHCSCDTCF